ncbi:hypothetical protein LIER_25790 [Lithospermum erythrorhizon]|uniref:Uncharacterized protein n=1 Tax=Lithospermum erythrorhizon TaxID=34254 RepID=A0AAV3R857_LITER
MKTSGRSNTHGAEDFRPKQETLEQVYSQGGCGTRHRIIGYVGLGRKSIRTVDEEEVITLITFPGADRHRVARRRGRHKGMP